jgi:hypothetical protein
MLHHSTLTDHNLYVCEEYVCIETNSPSYIGNRVGKMLILLVRSNNRKMMHKSCADYARVTISVIFMTQGPATPEDEKRIPHDQP